MAASRCSGCKRRTSVVAGDLQGKCVMDMRILTGLRRGSCISGIFRCLKMEAVKQKLPGNFKEMSYILAAEILFDGLNFWTWRMEKKRCCQTKISREVFEGRQKKLRRIERFYWFLLQIHRDFSRFSFICGDSRIHNKLYPFLLKISLYVATLQRRPETFSEIVACSWKITR
jgi:hypothetical protein